MKYLSEEDEQWVAEDLSNCLPSEPPVRVQPVVTRLEWSKATNIERNAACAAFMPASEINPIRSYYLTKEGKLWQRLAVKNLAEAKQWLAFAKGNFTRWEKIMPEMTWTDRNLVDVAEDTHHVRYSDTPGGAWMLIEELASKGWTVSVVTTGHSSGVSAILKSAHHHVIGKMEEAVAECFLKANGVDTSDAKPCNDPSSATREEKP